MSSTPLKNVIYFLCSPSLGLLDNWLPVIWSLKEKREDLKFIIIFPKPNIIDQINLSNILIILASKIFDSIVFKSQTGHWLTAETFPVAKIRKNRSTFERFLSKVIVKLNKWKLTKILGNVIHFMYATFDCYLTRKFQFNWKFVKENGLCVLYDVYDESKSYNFELTKIFKELPKFSIQHGININEAGFLKNTKQTIDVVYRNDIKAYLFSHKEIPFYEYKYAIHKSKMQVVGVPRHSSIWMKFIQSNILNMNEDFDSTSHGSIFIISRPSGTKYFPYKRKKKALEDIKRLAWKDLKKNIVVKLHPKEIKEGIYEDVFGKDTYGINWTYSDLHPFVLGKECDFAISFYSGVVIDMLALGVPTIEYLNLRGIPEFDNYGSLRDKINDPVFAYRYLNLVLGASDYKMMKAHFMEIINNKNTVLSKLQCRYNEIFPKIENINDKIARDILITVSNEIY